MPDFLIPGQFHQAQFGPRLQPLFCLWHNCLSFFGRDLALIQAWTKFGITWTSLGTDTRLSLPALPAHWVSIDIEQLSKATPENMVEPMPGIATPDDNKDSEAETLPLPGTHHADLESKIQAQPTPSRCNRS